MTWTIEKRQPYGDTPGPLQPRPSRWIPWPPAVGLTWRRGTDAMRWAIAAADHAPGTDAHTAELRRLAAVRDSTIRYEWRTPTGLFGNGFRLARTTKEPRCAPSSSPPTATR